MKCEDTFTICNENHQENGKDTVQVNGCKSTTCTVPSSACYMCNGYYGPCFEDPICAPCHAFLYPNTAPALLLPMTSEISNDSDSGNDEPVDAQENLPHPYEHLAQKMPAVRVDNLLEQLNRLGVLGPQYHNMNLELFPVEVLWHMFQYLDEISLWSIGQVCSRWREVLFLCVKLDRWKDFVGLRWPLLRLENIQQDWYELYSAMMLSANCFKCVKQMAAQKLPPVWQETSWRRNRLRSEVKTMRNDPSDGIEAVPLDLNCCHWQATIEGPAGSPYEGGLFFLYMQVPASYPLEPPVVRFITKIFHPNVSRHGDIGIDSIHHNWSLALTINKLLISIQSLLTDPFCDVCMEPEIGRLYLNDRKSYEEQARLWTVRHAMHDVMPH